jgi:predicted transcriptional regulator
MKGQLHLSESSLRLSHAQYRDRIYMIRDILLKLVEYGELNQTALISFCGLNLTKHRSIIEEMEAHELISREVQTLGRTRSVSYFKASPKGLEFFKEILEPYERMFPRSTEKH